MGTYLFYPKIKDKKNIPALEGLRAIAVLLVVFYHFGMQLHFPTVPGYLGVMIFFVLSGFLITWLLLREDWETSKISLKNFYLRRTLRIFPAFYAYWIFTVGLMLIFHKHVPIGFALATLFYVGNYAYALNRGGNTFMMQTWSLAIEEQFYLLWPLIFRRWRKNPWVLVKILTGLILAIWTWRIVLRLLFHVGRDYLQYSFDCRADALFVGCLLAILLRRMSGYYFEKKNIKTAILVERVHDKVCKNRWLPFVTIAVLAGTTILSNFLGPNYAQLVGFPIEEIAVAILLVQLVIYHDDPLWSWIESSELKFIGTISYSLYLYHGLGEAYLPARLRAATDALGIPGKLLIGLTISFTMAAASYFLIEKRFLKWKDSIGK